MDLAYWRRGLAARWRASPRLQDAANAGGTFLVGAALNLIGFTGVLPDAPPPLNDTPSWWHTVALGVGCAAMLFKRGRPLVALGVGVLAVLADLAIGGSVALVLVLFDLLFTAGLLASARGRNAVMTIVVVIIGTVSTIVGLAAGDARASVLVALQLTGLLVIPLWWAANLRQQREIGVLTAERARREAVYAERTAMARDLHDAVASHLSTTAIHSAAALARPPEAERDREALRAVRASSLAALDEMRTMIKVLRTGGDRPTGDDIAAPAGLAQLPQLLDDARASGLEVTADLRPADVSTVVGLVAYRIVYEALTNARKHAPGSRVRVYVGPVDDRLEVTVTNPLGWRTGPDHSGLGSGTGLLSMRERAAMVGGELVAGREGDVWRVRALLPPSGGRDLSRAGSP